VFNEHHIDGEIIVADNSTDNTPEIAKSLGAKVIAPDKHGYGNAYRFGFKKGLRNGNWRKLRLLDKALYRAAIGYAKRGGSIVNGMLVEKHFFQKEIFTKETILNYFIHFICKYKNTAK